MASTKRRRDEDLDNNDVLDEIPVVQLRSICRKFHTLTSAQASNRQSVMHTISSMNQDVQDQIREECRLVKARPVQRNPKPVKKRRRFVHTASSAEIVEDNIITNDFMKAPSPDVINQCITNFIRATGNDSLKTKICAVCAREHNQSAVEVMKWCDVPNSQLLKPTKPHPAHDLFFDGILLQPEGVNGDAVSICQECVSSLKRNRLPKFSLSNNLWIGARPFELRGLTLPERLMIARYYPAAYIIKLFPKQKNAKYWDSKQMHSGLKGNVSTYRLDPGQLATTIYGDKGKGNPLVFPPPAKILSALIAITFVGPKGLPESTLFPNTFQVRRRKVRDALTWLKQNNPLYQDISISDERLSQLPEEDVPDEIMLTVKYSNDMERLESERAGYVPEDESYDVVEPTADELEAMGLVEVADEDDGLENEVLPATYPTKIPLQSLGVVDVEGAEISTSELMAHALSNSGFENNPDDFTIRRGSAFVNEYARTDTSGQRTDGGPSNPNHLLGCFPTLFPYGEGGFEINRRVDVPYEMQARWSLLYCDRRFRKDFHFPAQVFGVCQKREVCRSAVLQMKSTAYNRESLSISKLSANDLIKASQEETKGVPFSNPAVRALRGQLRAVRTRVKGTDESRQHVRSKCWGMTLMLNPVSLWVTINPADTSDPIAQVLAGAEIDLDNFLDTIGPTQSQRAQNIAGDPFASAQFFHLMIRVILQELFGFKKRPTGVPDRQSGILGILQGYIGTVEIQGRGSLHLHLLIWLKDAPTSKDMQNALATEAFREKVKTYIAAVVKADIQGMTQGEIASTPKPQAVAYSRPANPQTMSEEELAATEKHLALGVQVHSCSTARCLKIVKGRPVCKRRAPFAISEEDWVSETGEWGCRRIAPYVNNFNPAVLTTTRANHDIKVLLNGLFTMVLAYYITCYATKKQEKSSNTSALLAKTLAIKRPEDKRQKDLNKINKRLIQRCANSLTRNREFSAPEIISYLMGWGDTYESHTFAMIYWDTIISTLKKQFPELDRRTSTEGAANVTEETPKTIGMLGGKLNLKDQLRDYQFRGDALSGMSLLDFVLNTYEVETKQKGQDQFSDDNNIASTSPPKPTRGRPDGERVPYHPDAKKPKTARMIRTLNHETLPRFIGRWFPRNDDPSERSLYCASMVCLLDPWQHISDIRRSGETFESRFQSMMSNASKRTQNFVQNAQYYHECTDAAAAERVKQSQQVWQQHNEIDIPESDVLVPGEPQQREDTEITEEDIELARLNRETPRELAYADAAIDNAYNSGVFKDEEINDALTSEVSVATSQQMSQILEWEKTLKGATRAMAQEIGVVDVSALGDTEATTIEGTEINNEPEVTPSTTRNQPNSKEFDRPKRGMLNEEQRRAHDIIEERLREHIAGRGDPLRMLVLGQGGTGKSTLIAAITETFAVYKCEHLLAKCASTGIAASAIGGQTLHSWAGLSIARRGDNDDWMDRSSPESQNRRRRNIEGKEFMILDEVSMTDKGTFQATSKVVVKTKGQEGKGSPDEPFGGMNVILFGDFHQFPPVLKAKGALYVEAANTDSRENQLGRETFLQFDKVIILSKQNRIQDLTWANILERLRVGECTEEDIDEIKKLVLTNPECDVPDFDCAPWNEAILVTPRHAVREQWNHYSLIKHCKTHNKIRYIVPAEDTQKDVEGRPTMEARLATAKLPKKHTGELADYLEIAIGMKAMVLVNVAVEADVANGTRGTVERIILDEREDEEQVIDEGTVTLQYPPALILFRPDKPTKIRFNGIPEGLIPISPSQVSFTAKGEYGEKYKITRRQYAITPGYAFTDYKSQGQTIEYVIIDIGKPPTGTLSPFSTYVALSRSRGRSTIRLLRDFDEDLFQHHPSEHLRRDMERMRRLEAETKAEWDAKKTNMNER